MLLVLLPRDQPLLLVSKTEDMPRYAKRSSMRHPSKLQPRSTGRDGSNKDTSSTIQRWLIVGRTVDGPPPRCIDTEGATRNPLSNWGGAVQSPRPTTDLTVDRSNATPIAEPGAPRRWIESRRQQHDDVQRQGVDSTIEIPTQRIIVRGSKHPTDVSIGGSYFRWNRGQLSWFHCW